MQPSPIPFHRCWSLWLTALLWLSCFQSLPSQAASFSEADITRELSAFKTYAYDRDAAPLRSMEKLVRQALADPDLRAHLERQMIQLLQSDATHPAKQFICQQLWIIGTDASLPALKQLLLDDHTSEIACYALRSFVSLQAGKALCQALDQAGDANKIRIMNLLGDRREELAVAPLLRLLAHPNPAIAESAAVALGKIGGAQAAQALSRTRRTAPRELRDTLIRASLQCAEGLTAEGQSAAARLIYLELMELRESNLTRRSAMLGIMRLGGAEALEQVLAILQGTDPWLKAAAIANSHLLQGDRATEELIAIAPRLTASDQALLVHALARREGARVKEALTALTDGTHPPRVRAAALEALGTIGDVDSIRPLLQALAPPSQPEVVAAALRSLRAIQGPGVEAALLAGLSTTHPQGRPALIQAMSDRNLAGATTALLVETRESEAPVRQAAFNALGKLAGPEQLPLLVECLVAQPDEAARQEAERAVLTVANRTEDAGRRTAPVLAALNRETSEAVTCSLLRILGGIADEAACQIVRGYLEDPNEQVRLTAVRELAAWPNAQVLPALEALWRNPDRENTHRVLALRGYLRLLGLPSDRSAAATLVLFEKAQSFATDSAEKSLLLSSLAKLVSPGALRLAASYLEDSQVAEEAALATVQIAAKLKQSDPTADLRPALNRVIALSRNPDLRTQAQKLLPGPD